MTTDTYQCHNRQPFRTTMRVQDGWVVINIRGLATRVPRMVDISFTGTPDCMYTSSPQGLVDPKCEGCKWKQPVIADNRGSGA